MMSLFHNIPFRRILPGLLLLLFAFSCRQEDSNELPTPGRPGSGETATVEFSIQIPGFADVVTTRANGIHEALVNNLNAYLFASEGGVEKVKARASLDNSKLFTSVVAGVTKISASVPVTAGTYTRIALIANAEDELNNAGINVGATYEQLKQVQAVARYGRAWKAGDPAYYIPMYGEYAPAGGFQLTAGVSQTLADEIPLIRMLARIDIVRDPAVLGMPFSSDINFFNAVKSGRIYTDPVAYSTGVGYMEPTLPATLEHAMFGGDLLTVEGDNVSSNVLTYYLNEQPATSTEIYAGSNHRPGILIRLDYEGLSYYYRLDYTWDGVKGGGIFPYEKGKFMPILRNHRYIFTIKEVKGPGFTTISEAIQSPENHTNHQNLVVTPVVVDESFTDVAFNEQGYFLATTRTAMKLKGTHDATNTQNRFTVRTNYPGGFRVKAYTANGSEVIAVGGTPPWLSSSVENGALNATLTNPVSQEVQAILASRGFNDGYLEVRAGRLYTRVNIVQYDKLPLDYVAEYNLAGGSQYGCFPTNFPAMPAQTDAALRWATDHNNDQSGYYSWYVLTGETHATSNPSGLNLFNDAFFASGNPGYGYHLPSHPELISISSHYCDIPYGRSSTVAANEAVEFGGLKKTFFSQYTSTGDGRAYALRFQQATGNPYGNFSISEFPFATDNSMCCAYRYTRMGGTDNRIKVECIYLGRSFTGNLGTISNERWWDSEIANPNNIVATRFFPLTGGINLTAPSGGGWLGSRNTIGFYWSYKEEDSGRAWRVGFHEDYAEVTFPLLKTFAVAVRLFSSD